MMSAAASGLRAPLILAAGAMTVMSGAAIAPALGELHLALTSGGGKGIDRFVLILPAIVVLFAGPLIGRMSSWISPRIVLCFRLALLAVAGALGGLANSYGWLLVTRGLLGVATAIVLCSATAAIVRFFEGPARGRMMSAQTACNTLSGVVFIVCGGLLATLSWRLAFAIYLLAVPVAILAWRLDWGDVLEAPAKQHGGAGIQDDLPMLGMIVLAMGCFYLLPTQVPFLQGVLAGPAEAALAIAGGTLASAPCAMLAPKLSRLLGRRNMMASGAGAMALGNLLMTLADGPLAATLAAVLVGSGFGLILPLAILVVMGRTGAPDREAKSGWVASAIYCGQVFAVVLATSAASWGNTVPFAISAGILAGGLVVALLAIWVRRLGVNARSQIGD
ncbi:MFS transporter [Roseibium sp. Sym1]|uniref:MFS transporter n=1 Tax=Roseibium sp. Sym1 TaxID=3016006 RepID=UPI0022B3C04E|nr:MFS transporter [Roseibium sp. Sym1]